MTSSQKVVTSHLGTQDELPLSVSQVAYKFMRTGPPVAGAGLLTGTSPPTAEPPGAAMTVAPRGPADTGRSDMLKTPEEIEVTTNGRRRRSTRDGKRTQPIAKERRLEHELFTFLHQLTAFTGEASFRDIGFAWTNERRVHAGGRWRLETPTMGGVGIGML